MRRPATLCASLLILTIAMQPAASAQPASQSAPASEIEVQRLGDDSFLLVLKSFAAERLRRDRRN
jgi:hypothetical protein